MILTKTASGRTIATIEGDTHISRWALEAGRLDHDQNTLPKLVPYLPKGCVVVDAGAFIGDHTVFYAQHASKVYAFEPNPEAFECLTFNAQGMRVKSYNAGLGSETGKAAIARDANAGASHLCEGDAVSIMTLDSLNLAVLHFMKLDIEGYEVQALEGAGETIERCRPVMLIEVNEGALNRQGTTPDDLFDLLDLHQYRYRNLHGGAMFGPQFDIITEPR